MPEPLPVWTGKDEHGGIPVQARKDLRPPPHWRLEAVVATHRPRSLSLARDGRLAVFVQDGETSDLWRLDLDAPVPRRLTTGRDPAPYWEDSQPRISPDGRTVAYADEEHVWIVATAGGPPARLVQAGSPVWIDGTHLVVSVERDDVTRLAVVEASDAWPQPLAREHGELETRGDEGAARPSPDGARVAYTFQPREDLSRSEIRVCDLATGVVRALTGTPATNEHSPAWSPDGQTLVYASEASGFHELHLVGADGTAGRRLTHEDADFSDPCWHPEGDRIAAVRGRRNRFDLVTVDVTTGGVDVVAPGGTWGRPHWTSAGDLVATYEAAGTPPELLRVTPGERPRTVHAPAPLAIAAAPHVVPEEVSYRSFDGLDIPAFLFRPRGASADRPVAAVVYPHGGPTSAYIDDWDGHAQFFLDKGYAWLAVNFRGSTGYGQAFERANHGGWGVDDTKDCLAGADFLRGLDWVDGGRLGIFGASYGAYLALLAVTDDPEHRFKCAVAKYGDCDLVTSWAQGDREGVQDLERMMGPPSAAREAYRAASAVHRLANVRAPLLVAHGERDDRVHPKQSEELVAELRRLGKTFEYVTYPTEGHGFLRAGPQIDFYRRLERFLDWYLM